MNQIIGYDNRYAFACPIYGSAHLDYQPAPATPRVFCETQVKKLWSAADRLHGVDFPVLWKCWTYDTDFSIGANSLSYLATKKSHSCLSISFDMGHSHYCGWVCEDICGFAKRVLEGKVPLIQAVTEPDGFVSIDFEVTIPEDFKDVSAELYYLTEPIEYDEKNNMTKEWKAVPAKIYGNSKVTVTVKLYAVEDATKQVTSKIELSDFPMAGLDKFGLIWEQQADATFAAEAVAVLPN